MVYSSKKYTMAIITAIVFSLLICLTLAAIFIVPLFIDKDYGGGYVAVVIAASLILFCFLVLFFTRKYRKRKRLVNKPFPPEWKIILNSHVSYYSSLSEIEKQRFHQEVLIFLGEKSIIPVEMKITDKIRVLVAASAIIPVFSFPDWEYDNLSEVLIYPRNFNEEFDFSGNNSNILGLVTGRGGTMILSKTALLHGFSIENDKRNVGYHEFIHKVDGLDGYVDGVPALLADKKVIRRWLEIVKSESAKIKEGKSDINPYGLTNNAEFFAVVSEYFFENPGAMSLKHPELYRILKEIFKQDTKSRFKSVVKSMFRPGGRKPGRNSPCPCGSGKKYKYCCLDKEIF